MKDGLIWTALYVGGYLLGSVMFSRLLPRLFMKKDICKLSDDGNPGSANVFKNCGVPMGMICLLLDMLKGFLPVFIAVMMFDTSDFRFAGLFWMPVLGHATAPFYHFHGGKCIATAFGEMIALLPVSRIGLVLAGLYIFFSTVWKISPNRVRSLVTFGFFALISTGWFFMTKKFALMAGCLSIALTAMFRHSKLVCEPAKRARVETAKVSGS